MAPCTHPGMKRLFIFLKAQNGLSRFAPSALPHYLDLAFVVHRIPRTWDRISLYAFLDLAYFGGHRRYILPPLSPSQSAIADGEIIFFRIDAWSFLSVFLFLLCFVLFLFCF